MIRGIDPNGDFLLAALHNLDSGIQRSQQQISSGLRVSKPSDSPQDVVDILKLNAGIDRSVQVQTNLGLVKDSISTSDSALQAAAKVLDQLIAIGTQGASTSSASQRPLLAEQVQQYLTQLVGISQTNINGRYVFGGDADQQPPYALDLSSPTGVKQLTTARATNQVTDINGTRISTSLTAQDIFDARKPDNTPDDGNVFLAVNRLRLALASNNEVQIEAALTALHSASDHLNRSLAFYGNAANQVDAAVGLAKAYESDARAALSEKRDADIPAVITEYNLQSTNRQAALSARAQTPKGSLFDYLG